MKSMLINTGLLFFLFITISSEAQIKSNTFRATLHMLLVHDVHEISITDAAKNAGSYLFLDAREEKEFLVSHLPNTRFVGYDHFNITTLGGLSRSQPIVVYCSIGKRSEDITRKLKKEGFTNVYNLYGGIFEWVNQDHPVYDMQNNRTDKVHAYGKFWGKFLNKGTKVF